MMHDSPASMSRNPTARTSPERSAHSVRRVARFSVPGLMLTTRKIAARLSGANTACGTAAGLSGASCRIIGVSMDNPKQRVTRPIAVEPNDLGVARNTVDWALGQLVADGYIVRRLAR